MQDESDKAVFRRTAELQSQMDQIGNRFLDRAVADLDAIEKALEALHAGDATAGGAIAMFAHRIRGSSAIFGYAGLSDAAGQLETLLESIPEGKAATAAEQIATHLKSIRAAARAARPGTST